jgi:hypothetical protein
MKKLLTLTALGLISLNAEHHSTTLGFSVDAKDHLTVPSFHLSLEHQSTFDFDDDNIIILHGLSHPYSLKWFHSELGVGYRKFYENFGFGINFVYQNQNSWGFFNHQLVPGVEIFYDHFALAYNRYLPFKTGVLFKKNKYLFHDVSEFTLSYRPSKKYEFSLTSNFNHQTRRFGYGGEVSAYFFDNIKLALTPFCEPFSYHGLSFSIGYDFGGAPKTKNQKFKKSHRFFHTSDGKVLRKIKEITGPSVMPTPAPIILVPADYEKAGMIYDEPIKKEESIEVKPKEKAKPIDKPKDPPQGWFEWVTTPQTKPNVDKK